MLKILSSPRLLILRQSDSPALPAFPACWLKSEEGRVRGCHSCPPAPTPRHRHNNTLQVLRRYHRELEQYRGTRWYTTPWQWLGMPQHNRERESWRKRERDECSSILRSEGKSPSVVVLLERLALTHEYFILLMFKSHHLWCGVWACMEIHWKEKEGCVCVRVCVCVLIYNA